MGVFFFTTPSGNRDFMGDREGVEVMAGCFKAARGVDLEVKPLELLAVDCGGACMVGEPDVTFEAFGMKCRVPVSQMPFLRDYLENAKGYKGTNAIIFGGWQGWYYALSFPARDAMLAELKRIEPSIREMAEAFEQKTKEMLAQSGVIDGRKAMPS